PASAWSAPIATEPSRPSPRSSPALLLSRGLLGCGLLGGGLLGGGLLGGLARRLLGRAPGAPIGEQLGGALVGQLLDRVVAAQRGVGLAVGDVWPEPPLAHNHRLARHR